MILHKECDLLIGNILENDSDTQYNSCKECHRFDICYNYFSNERINSKCNFSQRVLDNLTVPKLELSNIQKLGLLSNSIDLQMALSKGIIKLSDL